MASPRRLRRLAGHITTCDTRTATATITTVASAAPPSAAASCLDFSYSFIAGAGPLCAIRFVVESTCTVFDDTQGTAKVYYQCASCKSEDTFGRGTEASGNNLFQDPNYDFCPLYCTPTVPQGREIAEVALDGGDYVCWRRKLDFAAPALLAYGYNGRAQPTHGYRQTIDLNDDIPFGTPTLRLSRAPADAYEVDVDDFEAVRRATVACHQLVQVTEIRGEADGAGLRAVIECPVKTMNLAIETDNAQHHPAGTWQVDTGPVAVPDLTRRFERASDAISLGFIAINNLQPHQADFVTEQPTPLPAHPEIQVLHYSHPITVPATSRLIAIPPPSR